MNLEEAFEQHQLGIRKTIILRKDNMIGLLAMNLANQDGAAIYRFDPRLTQPEVAVYNSEEEAKSMFNKSLESSFENGWTILHSGLPNFG